MRLVMPRLYVILDAGLVGGTLLDLTQQLVDAGVHLLQYRDKTGTAAGILNNATTLAKIARQAGAAFILNDRPDIAFLCGAHGVHVGQDDLNPDEARQVIGKEHWVGVSTHNPEQFAKAAASSADYIAIGPIFETNSKLNPDPVVGKELIRRLRPMTDKPMVAIGGIRLERAAEVLQAGADSVAVISDILLAARPAERARQFLQQLEAVNLTGR
jgi:thiamine-phosphate pyrophosphorylase